MIHIHLFEQLTQLLGEGRDEDDWTEWLMEYPGDARLIRVRLNRKLVLKDTAQVVVFDPTKDEGQGITEISASTIAQADAIIERIKSMKRSAESAG